MLTAVAEGAADVALGNIQVINELIQAKFGGRVRISGTVRDGDSELFLAVPRRSPELTRVLRSGMDAINDSEMAAVRARWLLIEVSRGPSWRAVLQIVIPIAAAAGLYLALLRRGNRRLRASREREMQARALAEEHSAARGRFLAYLSHELRGGLGAVASGAEMLQANPDPGLRDRLLTAIADSVNGLRKMLDVTLAYEQSSRAALTLQVRTTDLQTWWPEAIAPGQLAAQRKGLTLDARWDGPMPCVEIDAARLQQVLQNLIGNAVKFTAHGQVSVGGSLQSRAAGARELVLEVRDSGPGIDAADRAHLFEPYAQGAQGRAQRDGAGLGLAIAQQIVLAMRGRIEVESEPGVGACFRVRVPVA